MKRRALLLGVASMPLWASMALCRGGPEEGRRSNDSLTSGSRLASIKVSAFGTDASALQRAIDSNAREIVVDTVVTVASDIRLRSDQAVRFAGGRLRVPAGARFAKAVLYGEGISGTTIAGAVIERVRTRGAEGVTGIRLVNAGKTRIDEGRLIGANLMLESYDGTIPRVVEVAGLVIDMAGWSSTAVYISGIAGVVVRDVECFGGAEGVGIYNGSNAVRMTRISSHHHARDGFVIIAGNDVLHEDCRAYDNGQSGFTTQRQSTARDSRNSQWNNCKAWNNGYDGFDMRGAVSKPWGVATGFGLTSCRARDNRRCGFYVVMAEGTSLTDCSATGNDAQNLFVDTSDDVVVRGFRSVSGAVRVPPGPNKAGILIYDSQRVRLERPVSLNEGRNAQDFGVSLTGRSGRARMTGGALSGNNVRAVYAAVDVLTVE